MIRTCLFDLGNVLLRFSHDRMYEQIAALCDRLPADVRQGIEASGLTDAFECGQTTQREFQRRLEDNLGCVFDSEALTRAVADIFEPDPALPPILDQLRRAGRRLVLFSNTNQTHFDWIQQQYDILDHFDDLVLSFRVGAMKPDAPIYQAALQTIDCDPAECFYTDDLLANIESGRAFGLQAELYVGPQELKQQLQSQGIDVQ